MEGKESPGMTEKIAAQVFDKLYDAQRKKIRSKEKKFMKIKLSKQQLKKGYVNVILLRANGSINLKKVKVEDGAVFLPETKTSHMAEGMHIWNYKERYPVMILPEWSVEPIYRDKLAQKTKDEGMNIDAQKFIIKKAEEFAAGMKPPKPGINPMIILYVVIGIVVIYLISSAFGSPIF